MKIVEEWDCEFAERLIGGKPKKVVCLSRPELHILEQAHSILERASGMFEKANPGMSEGNNLWHIAWVELGYVLDD